MCSEDVTVEEEDRDLNDGDYGHVEEPSYIEELSTVSQDWNLLSTLLRRSC